MDLISDVILNAICEDKGIELNKPFIIQDDIDRIYILTKAGLQFKGFNQSDNALQFIDIDDIIYTDKSKFKPYYPKQEEIKEISLALCKAFDKNLNDEWNIKFNTPNGLDFRTVRITEKGLENYDFFNQVWILSNLPFNIIINSIKEN